MDPHAPGAGRRIPRHAQPGRNEWAHVPGTVGGDRDPGEVGLRPFPNRLLAGTGLDHQRVESMLPRVGESGDQLSRGGAESGENSLPRPEDSSGSSPSPVISNVVEQE